MSCTEPTPVPDASGRFMVKDFWVKYHNSTLDEKHYCDCIDS